MTSGEAWTLGRLGKQPWPLQTSVNRTAAGMIFLLSLRAVSEQAPTDLA